MDAAYPVTAHLFREMEVEYKNSPFHQQKEDWKQFTEFRQSAPSPLSVVLRSRNPELVLTVPDLLEATLDAADAENWRNIRKAAAAGNQELVNQLQSHWTGQIRDPLVQATKAKEAFQRLADDFFSRRHYCDSADEGKSRRIYLHNALGKLSEDDIVITTNWDTLAERVLLDQGRWLPTDGYGFNVQINSGPLWPKDRQERLVGSSKIKILKLHGSTGWFLNADGSGTIYLRHDNYLQYFVPPGHAEIHDIESPGPGAGPNRHPVVVFPSYLKRLENEVLQAIWNQAARALYSASQITFVGYSLPGADVAIRALLNPIRQRLADKTCSVTTVVSNDSEAELRWKCFLGPDVTVVRKTARDFFG